MAHEPSNGELGYRLDQIMQVVQSLASRGEYDEFKRHVEHRFAEVDHRFAETDRDVEQERQARAKGDEQERTARENAVKEIRTEQQTRGNISLTARVGFYGAVAAALVMDAINSFLKGFHH